MRVGDHVRLNHTVSPKYLRGQVGHVVAIDDDCATVRLRQPVGRFDSGEIQLPSADAGQAPQGG